MCGSWSGCGEGAGRLSRLRLPTLWPTGAVGPVVSTLNLVPDCGYEGWWHPLNVAVVPRGPLPFLTVWPSGVARPS